MLRQMAYKNANAECRKAIRTLPRSPRPTIKQMMEVVAREVPLQGAPDTKAKPRQSSVAFASPSIPEDEDLSAVVAGSLTPGAARRNPGTHPCHLCGKTGHWMADCLLWEEFLMYRRKECPAGKQDSKQQKN